MKQLFAFLLVFQIGTPSAWAKLATIKAPAKLERHVGFLAALPAEGRPVIFDNGHARYTLKPSVFQRNHTKIRFHKMDRQISLIFGPADVISIQPSVMKVAKGDR